MSGHSKWATIHRKKGLLDAERGKIFQKIARELYVAAKGTNGDPADNPNLRLVVEKAKSNNMPKDNIQKAIDKAVKSAGGEDYESVRYEGYGPNGVAFMVDCLTDNRNRTAMLVRSTFTKRGGNLGTDGSVSYLFNKKGIININDAIIPIPHILYIIFLFFLLAVGFSDPLVNKKNELYANKAKKIIALILCTQLLIYGGT